MLAEIAVSAELSGISKSGLAVNFVQIVDCNLVSGIYPQALLDRWDEYDEQKGSENDRPDTNLASLQYTIRLQELLT